MINKVHGDDETESRRQLLNMACAEPVSRPKPAAWRVEAKRRALTPASPGRHFLAAGEPFG